MAKIDEERILIRVSLLIRDTVSAGNVTFLTPELISSVETYVADQLETTAGLGVVVEANDATSWSIVVPPPVPTYLLEISANVVSEGNSVTASITTTAVDDNTVLYWTASGTTANVDFDGNVNYGTVNIFDNQGVFTVGARVDGQAENVETFVLQLRTVSNIGNIVATSQTITVANV